MSFAFFSAGSTAGRAEARPNRWMMWIEFLSGWVHSAARKTIGGSSSLLLRGWLSGLWEKFGTEVIL
jgi:hypothetical protein